MVNMTKRVNLSTAQLKAPAEFECSWAGEAAMGPTHYSRQILSLKQSFSQ
uniref:Uncharacterized protein n=1 Tax=Rhizophora mucronata TaxID=61149 RepID=A0A2P2PF04_RHIMU